jgi:hypothetical protein
MKSIVIILVTLAGLQANAASFPASCYKLAKAVAVNFTNKQYSSQAAQAVQADDGEADDVHVEIRLGDKELCVDVGIIYNGEKCANFDQPQFMDCAE